MNHDTHIPSHILYCVLTCPHTFGRLTPELLDAMAAFPGTTEAFMRVCHATAQHQGSMMGVLLALNDNQLIQHIADTAKYMDRLCDLDGDGDVETIEKMLDSRIEALMRRNQHDDRSISEVFSALMKKRS